MTSPIVPAHLKIRDNDHLTKYRAEFCELLIEHMSKGFPISSFGSVVGVSRQTVNQWAKYHQEFAEARAIGLAKSEQFYVKQALDHLIEHPDSSKINTKLWGTLMRNIHKWDRMEKKLDQATLEQRFAHMSREERIAELKKTQLVVTSLLSREEDERPR